MTAERTVRADSRDELTAVRLEARSFARTVHATTLAIGKAFAKGQALDALELLVELNHAAARRCAQLVGSGT